MFKMGVPAGKTEDLRLPKKVVTVVSPVEVELHTNDKCYCVPLQNLGE